ncbi:hypothetical protein DMUE_4837 [Dictyocoela muelleri]|nr:hypothetical protein DMUE_4837 [Dictyocoela muelleri]
MQFRRNNSINHFSKSLLVNQFKFGEYGNLSSRKDERQTIDVTCHSTRTLRQLIESITAEEENLKPKIFNDPTIETANFEYKNELSGLRITHKLNLLVSLDKQDVIHWRTAFKELARICTWSNDVQLEVLRQITDLNLQYQIGEASSADEFLYKLMKLKYNHQTAHKYQTRLLNIRQNNYYTIRAYIHEIEVITQKLSLCLDWCDNMVQEKVQELCYGGWTTQ